MKLHYGHSWISFQEPDLATPLPACLPMVAALLAAGFRLPKDGSENLSDVLRGPRHLQDFRGQNFPSRKMYRLLVWHFIAKPIYWEGHAWRWPKELRAALESDPALIAAAQRHPHYLIFLTQLRAQVALARHRQLNATGIDPQGERSLLVPAFPNIHAQEKKLNTRLAHIYENG